MEKKFNLETETVFVERKTYQQLNLFPQWYEFYVTNETEEPVPLEEKKPIAPWWKKNQYS